MFESINKFTEAIINSKYYDAHEYLEEWWFPKRKTKTPEVLFVKGLINSAVSFELYKKDRLENAKKVWNNYLKYKILINEFDSIYKMEYIKVMALVESKAKQKGIY
jgi:hypothetical protein